MGYEAERQRQLARYRRFGLKSDQFPKIHDQPDGYAGRFDRPVLVDPTISFFDQAKSIGVDVTPDINVKSLTTWLDDHGRRTPQVPYVIWMQDTLRPNQSALEARSNAQPDEVMLNQFELVAYLLTLKDHHDAILEQDFCAPGTNIGNGYVLVATYWMGSSMFDYEMCEEEIINGNQLTRGAITYVAKSDVNTKDEI